MLTRIRYVKKEDGKLRTKNDIIIADLFYSAVIDPVDCSYEIDTPNGVVKGTATSLHYSKLKIKKYFSSLGGRFKKESRAKRK